MVDNLLPFFKNLWQALFPLVMSVSLYAGRILMALIALFILIRCTRSLFRKPENEIWGFLRLQNGVEYPLTHWENTIGRAKNCDICLNFPSVSRNHANLCRDDRGIWRIYPINTKSGVLINGSRSYTPTEVKLGDTISAGGISLYFFPADIAKEIELNRGRTAPGKLVSRAGTLWLLTLFQLLTLSQFIPLLNEENFFPICISFATLCVLMWLLFILYRICSRTAFEAETLVFFLLTVSFAIIAAYSPITLFKQLAAVIFGILLFIFMSLILRNLPFSMKLRWPVAVLAVGLLAFNVLFGQRIFGAKNWVSLGPFSFQPSEFVKMAFVLVGSATLDRLFAKRNLIFTAIFSAYCVGCLALMSDFGTALVFFVAFLCIAFLRSGDLPSVVMITVAAGVAGGIILHFKPYIADRFAAWRHVWEFSSSTGYQQTRAMSALASGGFFGVGPEKGWLKYLGAANTDLVFGVVGEEFGLILSLCCVAAIVILAVFTLRCAATSRSAFYTIASCAAVAMFVMQAILNVLGAVDILPLTGVTFPFVSAGGSSAISCWGLLAFLKAADTRPAASFTVRLPKDWRKALREPVQSVDESAENLPIEAEAEASPVHHGEGFFADRPDIPVDDIFGKAGEDE